MQFLCLRGMRKKAIRALHRFIPEFVEKAVQTFFVRLFHDRDIEITSVLKKKGMHVHIDFDKNLLGTRKGIVSTVKFLNDKSSRVYFIKTNHNASSNGSKCLL